MTLPKDYMVTIGGSAGGIEALSELLSQLPADLPAPLLAVIHIPPQGPNLLPAILKRAGKLPAKHPINGEIIQHGQIYIAPPDQHMLIEKNVIKLRHGPKINHSRPAIDPLFRSAAISYGNRAIGIVLSGLLDDGTAGLLAIKRQGGVIIVQDPQEAQFPDMPNNVLKYLPVDYCLPINKIAEMLIELVNNKPLHDECSMPAPTNLARELNMLTTCDHIPENEINKLGQPSVFTCPECHGTLWEINEETITRFCCRIGHGFGIDSLASTLAENVEDALWAALRSLEEKVNLAERLVEKSYAANNSNVATFIEKAQRAKGHAKTIREILLGNNQETN